MERDRNNRPPSIADPEMASTVDPVLTKWYQQKAEGIPEEQRVKLSLEQQQHIELDRKFSEAVANLKPDRHASNTGRMAVSATDLANAD